MSLALGQISPSSSTDRLSCGHHRPILSGESPADSGGAIGEGLGGGFQVFELIHQLYNHVLRPLRVLFC